MLGFAKRTVPPSELGFGLFGKIASCGDFISVGEYSPAVAHLSRWLEEGVGWATTQAKPTWETLDFAAPRAFLFRSDRSQQSDRLVFGLLQPSRDTVGRHFPLAVFGELSLGTELDGFPLLPLATGETLETVAGILERATSGVDPRGLLGGLLPTASSRLASARAEFSAWAAGTRISAVLSSIFRDETGQAASNALGTLWGILTPFIGKEFPETPLSIRLPLGVAGVGGAVFWMELIRRALRWKKTVPVAFWHAYSDSGQLVLSLGDPSPRVLLGLWAANDLDDAHCDLTGNSVAYGELPKAFALGLGHDVTIAELMESL